MLNFIRYGRASDEALILDDPLTKGIAYPDWDSKKRPDKSGRRLLQKLATANPFRNRSSPPQKTSVIDGQLSLRSGPPFDTPKNSCSMGTPRGKSSFSSPTTAPATMIATKAPRGIKNIGKATETGKVQGLAIHASAIEKQATETFPMTYTHHHFDGFGVLIRITHTMNTSLSKLVAA